MVRGQNFLNKHCSERVKHAVSTLTLIIQTVTLSILM